MMDLITSALSGFVVKIYDDFTENNIISDGFLKESLHTLSTMLLGASALGDFVYVFILYLINFLSHLGNDEAFSELKEKSILYIYPIFFILTLPNIRSFNIAEIITITTLSFGSYHESYMIKEEVSLRKLIMRSIVVVCSIIILLLGLYFNFISKSLSKVYLFGISYLFASCCFQAYSLYNKHIEIKNFEVPIWIKSNKNKDLH
jgi:hypothetical protein